MWYSKKWKTSGEAWKRLFSAEVFSFFERHAEARSGKDLQGIFDFFANKFFLLQAGFLQKMAKVFQKQDFRLTLICFPGNRVTGQSVPLAVS